MNRESMLWNFTRVFKIMVGLDTISVDCESCHVRFIHDKIPSHKNVFIKYFL